MSKQDAEDSLADALSLAGGQLAAFERQHPYIPGRRFRADFAWPAARLLAEVQGGVFSRQAHGSITGILADIERGNLAAINGWRVLRFATARDTDTWIAECLDTIEQALALDVL